MKSDYFTGKGAIQAYVNQNQSLNSKEMPPLVKAKGSRTFSPWDGDISVRSDYNRRDYESFRPSETLPKDIMGIIRACEDVYKRVGLVQNVINTMADFGSQGIRVQCDDERQQAYYNSWFKKVLGKDRSERFLNYFYRTGQTIVKKAYAKISVSQEKNWKRGVAEVKLKLEDIKTVNREIPVKYTFLSPLSLEVVGGEGALFIDKPQFMIRVSGAVKGFVQNSAKIAKNVPGYQTYQDYIARIPLELKDEILSGKEFITLDQSKIEAYYYKKDDWDLWARPMIACILDDIVMLSKMKQADIAALDGAISNIRLWNMGIITDNAQTTILPNRAQIDRLRSILAQNVGGGVMDLVWGPELKFTESNSQVYKFLGSEKYASVLNSIYESLGIPPSLRATTGNTNTGNFIGLNTMIKRLEYGRDALTEFWENELAYVHKAMGFSGPPPSIMYDYMILADEAAEKQLLINLWDRDIIPTETILEIFGRTPGIEKSRIKREVKERGKEMPDKASPYHTAEKGHEYNKALLAGGDVAPSELGIELQTKKPGEKSRFDKQAETQLKVGKMKAKEAKKSGIAGRPKNKTETTKRKAKPKEKPSAKADLQIFLWASQAQEQIHNIINPGLLKSLNKTTARQLSEQESDQIEYVKFGILSNLEPFSTVTTEVIQKTLTLATHAGMYNSSYHLIKEFVGLHKRNPSIDELRQIYAGSYSLFYSSNDTE